MFSNSFKCTEDKVKYDMLDEIVNKRVVNKEVEEEIKDIDDVEDVEENWRNEKEKKEDLDDVSEEDDDVSSEEDWEEKNEALLKELEVTGNMSEEEEEEDVRGDNTMRFTYKGSESKLEVQYKYLDLKMTPKVMFSLLSRVTGMVLMVNYYIGTTEEFERLTFTNKVYNLSLPSILGYMCGEYIVKGMILFYMYKKTIGM